MYFVFFICGENYIFGCGYLDINFLIYRIKLVLNSNFCKYVIFLKFLSLVYCIVEVFIFIWFIFKLFSLVINVMKIKFLWSIYSIMWLIYMFCWYNFGFCRICDINIIIIMWLLVIIVLIKILVFCYFVF